MDVYNINSCNLGYSIACLIGNHAKVLAPVTIHRRGNEQLWTNFAPQNFIVSVPLVGVVVAGILHLHKYACRLTIDNV